MALQPLPPWLNVNPSNYVDAAKSGSAIGLQIAEAQNRGDQQSLDAALRMQAMAQREDELARERAVRQWEFQQKLKQDALQLAETARYHDLSIKEAMAGHAAQSAHWKAMAEASKARSGGKGILPVEWNRDPLKEYVTANGAVVPPKRMLPTEYQTVVTERPAAYPDPGTPAIPAQKKYGIFGWDWTKRDQPFEPGIPARPGNEKQTITTRIPITATNLPPGAVAPPPPPPAAQSAGSGRGSWTDKSGNVYRYIGNSPDPKSDKNKDNWVYIGTRMKAKE